MFGTPRDKIKKWLESTIEGSEKAVDHGWEVAVDADDENFLIIDTDQMPFKIIVQVEEQLTYIALITAINTKGKDLKDTEEVFRVLLRKNREMALSKFILLGEEDTVSLRTDLYTQHMDKAEFNMALENVILGGRWLIAQLGESEDANRMAKEMSELGSAELLKGTPAEEVAAKMVEAGYAEDQAKPLTAKLAQQLGLAEKEEKTPPPAKEGARVDNYIW